MTKNTCPPFGVKSKPIALLGAAMLMGTLSYAQTIAPQSVNSDLNPLYPHPTTPHSSPIFMPHWMVFSSMQASKSSFNSSLTIIE
jgi:hypothetical protein